MKYVGSKSRLAKHILPIILSSRTPGQLYVEPFVGGCNCIEHVTGPRLANDSHRPLIAMWRKLIEGWIPPIYSKEEYIHIRDHRKDYPDYVVGWVGFNLSYCGKYFAGFAGKVSTKQGIRDYQQEARTNVLKQVPKLKDVQFENTTFFNFYPPTDSIVYCDPPYAGTTGYTVSFDQEAFWEWCSLLAKRCTVYVSEYDCPIPHKIVYKKKVKSSLSANREYGSSKDSIEKLFLILA